MYGGGEGDNYDHNSLCTYKKCSKHKYMLGHQLYQLFKLIDFSYFVLLRFCLVFLNKLIN